jgi:hypothetical protein
MSCRAFCVEKNSIAPQVEIVGGEGCTPTIMDAYVTVGGSHKQVTGPHYEFGHTSSAAGHTSSALGYTSSALGHTIN